MRKIIAVAFAVAMLAGCELPEQIPEAQPAALVTRPDQLRAYLVEVGQRDARDMTDSQIDDLAEIGCTLARAAVSLEDLDLQITGLEVGRDGDRDRMMAVTVGAMSFYCTDQLDRLGLE